MLLVWEHFTVVKFYEKEIQKANQNEFRVEKLIHKKDDMLRIQ